MRVRPSRVTASRVTLCSRRRRLERSSRSRVRVVVAPRQGGARSRTDRPALGTMPGWPCCATPRSPPSTATSTTRRAGSRGPRRPTSCTRWSTTHEREVGTYLLGRRLYETMRYWETAPGDVPGPMRGVRPDLAGGGQGGLLDHPRRRDDGAHPARRVVRPGRGRGAQGVERARRQRGRRRPWRWRRSAPAWSTTCTSSCTPCSSVVARGRCPTGCTTCLDLVTADRIGDVVHLHHRVRR